MLVTVLDTLTAISAAALNLVFIHSSCGPSTAIQLAPPVTETMSLPDAPPVVKVPDVGVYTIAK